MQKQVFFYFQESEDSSTTLLEAVEGPEPEMAAEVFLPDSEEGPEPDVSPVLGPTES